MLMLNTLSNDNGKGMCERLNQATGSRVMKTFVIVGRDHGRREE
jgi:hypothetical protein